MQTVQTPPTYLTARDVQELIRVDRSTIYRMAESGRLPAIKVGRQWRFPADAVHAWLAACGNGADGDLVMMPSNAGSQSASASTIHVSADSGNIYAGGNGVDGDLVLKNNAGSDVVHIDGGNGNFIAGGDGGSFVVPVFPEGKGRGFAVGT